MRDQSVKGVVRKQPINHLNIKPSRFWRNLEFGNSRITGMEAKFINRIMSISRIIKMSMSRIKIMSISKIR